MHSGATSASSAALEGNTRRYGHVCINDCQSHASGHRANRTQRCSGVGRGVAGSGTAETSMKIQRAIVVQSSMAHF
ncbi:hypothetical protein VTH06DRAFT_8022 [Thermothelomyces fergusii]